MANSPKRIYWDACAWIALIQREKIRDPNGVVIEDRETMCKSVINAAKRGEVEIVTSTLSLVEVCKSPLVKGEGEDQIGAYFENDYVILASLDRFVGERGRELMLGGYAGLKPPDAAHVASAAVTDVDEMHTFDRKLLDMNGVVDKADRTKLKICKPGEGGAPLPLLEWEHGAGTKADEPAGADEEAQAAEIVAAYERGEIDIQFESGEGAALSPMTDAVRQGPQKAVERPSEAPANEEGLAQNPPDPPKKPTARRAIHMRKP
jgi:predicted nucleic acid-binding protein